MKNIIIFFFTKTLKVICSEKNTPFVKFKSILPPIDLALWHIFVRKKYGKFFQFPDCQRMKIYFSSEYTRGKDIFIKRNSWNETQGGWQSRNALLPKHRAREWCSIVTCNSHFCKPGFLKISLKFTYSFRCKNELYLKMSCTYTSFRSWLQLACQHFRKLDHIYLIYRVQRAIIEYQETFLFILVPYAISHTLFQSLKVWRWQSKLIYIRDIYFVFTTSFFCDSLCVIAHQFSNSVSYFTVWFWRC